MAGDEKLDRLRTAVGDRNLVISAVCLAELVSLELQGRVRGRLANDARATARVEPVTEEDGLEGGAIHGRLRARPHAKGGMADALILATAQRLGIALLTLDRDLEGERGVELLSRS